ncbi:MAG: aminotransferase class V-fold PLP-dependent enzyme [Anaerolineales bacterium]|nr:aminotransferase class V-fold PLP-dependent enzyme [Anaerolineales bacterium]
MEQRETYNTLGLKPIINANATLTRLGGSRMPAAVVEAMAEASRHFVDLDELQRAVGGRLAELTGNEAAYVSTGAAAGLTLAAVACMAGTDPKAMAQLPDTTGLRHEFIVHRTHRNGYDYSVRMTGARLVEIGTEAGTSLADFEAAITPQTAGVFWFQGAMTTPKDIPLAELIPAAARHGLPVIVDGAAQLPPTENLWRWTEMGAALAIFSGGKDLRGPQTTGLVVGRADLIEAIRRNGSPNHSFGRPMKVGKEEMMGLLKAVELYLEIDQELRREADEATVAGWCETLNALPGVNASRGFPNEAGQPLPYARVQIDPATGKTRDQVQAELLAGDPAISVATVGDDALFVNPMTLDGDERDLVLARLLAVLSE